MDKRFIARLVMGPMIILGVWFAFQREDFIGVWKPLALYLALAAVAVLIRWRLGQHSPASR
jgi:hypothetical protein